MGFIYKITNKLNGKAYVGETIHEPKKRWRQHIDAAKASRGCPYLTTAFKKHGIENFKFEVLIICFDEDRFEYEKEYIKKYNTLIPNGYNATECGRGGFIGKKHSDESKKKISEKGKLMYKENPKIREEVSNLCKINNKKMHESKKIIKEEKIKKLVEEGKTLEEATKEVKLSYSRFKNSYSSEHKEEAKKKISESLKKYYASVDNNALKESKKEAIKKAKEEGKFIPKKSRITSEETKKILSERMKKYHEEKKEERIALMSKKLGKSVNQYSLEGVLLATYDSINEAARQNDISSSSIKSALKKEEKISHGFRWELVK